MTGQLINTRSPVRGISAPGADGNIEINAWGKILAVRPELHANRYRVSVKLFTKDQERAVVSQYVSQRQTEIIRDLRILSEELFKRKK